MGNFSIENFSSQLQFGFDLASDYLTRPIVILLLLGSLVVVWRLLNPHK